MTEEHVGFLFKAASSLIRPGENHSLTFLRSYYLMRCKDITKGYGLPDKHFSTKVRCSKCSIEWKRNTVTKVKPLRLSRKQRRRIRSQKGKKSNKEEVAKKKALLMSNQIEQICSFCKKITVTTALKPQNITLSSETRKQTECTTKTKAHNAITKDIEQTICKKNDKVKKEKKKEINVYSHTTEVFSLYNKKNTLENVKREEKVIKNNKKKKDKFAGLCQKAVLATAKLKQDKDKNNKLNLFLKQAS